MRALLTFKRKEGHVRDCVWGGSGGSVRSVVMRYNS